MSRGYDAWTAEPSTVSVSASRAHSRAGSLAPSHAYSSRSLTPRREIDNEEIDLDTFPIFNAPNVTNAQSDRYRQGTGDGPWWPGSRRGQDDRPISIASSRRNDYRAPSIMSGRSFMNDKRASISSRLHVGGDRHKMMINYVYSRLKANLWLMRFSRKDDDERPASIFSGYSRNGQDEWKGVLLRNGVDSYVARPRKVPQMYLDAIKELNVEVAFTMSNETTETLFETLAPDRDMLEFPGGARYQIVESIEDIVTGVNGRIKKLSYCCLVRKERIVLVWHDDISVIMPHAEQVEQNMVSFMWGGSAPKLTGSGANSSSPSILVEKGAGEKKDINIYATEIVEAEEGKPRKESFDRPVVFTSAVIVGLAVALLIVIDLGSSMSTIVAESVIDGQYFRFAFLLATPVFFTWGLFFASNIWSCIFQIFGPIGSIKQNTRFYSGIKPDLAFARKEGFTPEHVTIQMPVYKEGLDSVIKPTVTSLKAAISQYELQGGTANIFVNDDGMQLISEEDRKARMQFYRDNNIGWVSRPGHGVDGFVRGGKFKKASNMNFCLGIANKVEDMLLKLYGKMEQAPNFDGLTEQQTEKLYQKALKAVLDNDPRAWAGGNIRMGRYILIVDSDTRVPVDCLIYGAAEMFLNPEVAVIQHSTGVMQVQWDYFENGLTFFTNLIYSAIKFCVGSGETAPFVGHNAFLRYAAIQAVAVKTDDGRELYWSESHVSEDFDVALRLQIAGNVVRLGAYHGQEFKEGVSLTIYDELSRWEKYAYGCNELVFNPIYKWYKGPFTPLFWKFLFSSIPTSSKLSTIGYIATYYALAFSLPMTVMNYFLIGWYSAHVDHFYLESWKVWLSVIAVFSGLSPIALAVVRYRLGEKGFLSALFEIWKWLPMMTVFFGGVSFHVLLAICAHAFGIDMQWGATSKEKTASNFFKEIPKIAKAFKWMYMVTIPIAAAMVYLGCFAPHGWRITQLRVVLPLAVNLSCHLILPLVLNPSLMVFNY